ncbi:LytTR family DNA-binding domain-containing protein [Olivibacter sp. XZL3]|uniref:LytR/AlgR family response regulator transcription factor n=1 Tax=Olivibacter sp. XZL3 TaxID=1735116 RepID=UPI00106693F6|nr:response regulator [Olivibacter sp. XZL3]
MIKAVLIDDEPLARSIISEYLADYKEIQIIEECNDGFEGAKAIMQHQPDLVFLDIQMPKINGFEMLELIDQQPPVIFTTAFDEYAIRAFEKYAIDYLLKPISKSRFDQAISKFLQQRNVQSTVALEQTKKMLETISPSPSLERIVVKTGNKINVIAADNLICLEADDDYVHLHTTTGSYLKNKTMAFFEKELDPNIFVRIHRSYIVRIDSIVRLEAFEKESHIAILSNNMKVNVSKSGYSKLKQVLDI